VLDSGNVEDNEDDPEQNRVREAQEGQEQRNLSERSVADDFFEEDLIKNTNQRELKAVPRVVSRQLLIDFTTKQWRQGKQMWQIVTISFSFMLLIKAAASQVLQFDVLWVFLADTFRLFVP